jgi:hypothetical protein
MSSRSCCEGSALAAGRTTSFDRFGRPASTDEARFHATRASASSFTDHVPEATRLQKRAENAQIRAMKLKRGGCAVRRCR